jgi:hypothetical protein
VSNFVGIKDIAKDISHQMSMRMSRSERVFTQDLFAEELAPRLSATDLKVLLRYLSRDRGECVFDGKVGRGFCRAGSSAHSHRPSNSSTRMKKRQK